MFNKIYKAFVVAGCNFYGWHKNLRIYLCFIFEFIMCYLLTDKSVKFAEEFGTIMQITEPFIWVFGDSNSILLISVLLIFLFADMPQVNASTPLFLMRTDRKTWLAGQFIYIICATIIFLLFILISTSLVCIKYAYIGNVWSPTAAILSYSNSEQTVAIPSMLKTLELSHPYKTTFYIFVLMLFYSLVLVFVMLYFNLRKGKAMSFVSVFAFSVYGFVLNPETIKKLFHFSDDFMYKANVIVGWLSPLNQATYQMHNFGYDKLPTIAETLLIFSALIIVLFVLSVFAIRKYNFNFTGTEG